MWREVVIRVGSGIVGIAESCRNSQGGICSRVTRHAGVVSSGRCRAYTANLTMEIFSCFDVHISKLAIHHIGIRYSSLPGWSFQIRDIYCTSNRRGNEYIVEHWQRNAHLNTTSPIDATVQSYCKERCRTFSANLMGTIMPSSTSRLEYTLRQTTISSFLLSGRSTWKERTNYFVHGRCLQPRITQVFCSSSPDCRCIGASRI
jgi:hypothetical protein